jgi:hypothetical protein
MHFLWQKLTVHEDELFPTIQSDFAQLCAQNVMLWTQYIQVVTLCQRVTYILAQEHHSQRVCCHFCYIAYMIIC